MFISEEGIPGKVVVAKIKPGEDLFSALIEIIKKHDIRCGYIPIAQGCLKECRLLTVEEDSSDDVNLINNRFDYKEAMIFSGNGTIARDDNDDVFIHMHPTITRESGEALMGHLIAGIVCLTAEIVIVALDDIKMGRKADLNVNNETLLYLEKY